MNQRPVPHPGYVFEQLCHKILAANGITDESDTLAYRNPSPPDFIGRDEKTGSLVVAETRLYLSTKIRLDLLYDANQRLLQHKEQYPGAKLLLITSVPLNETEKSRVLGAGVNEVWDLPVLAAKAAVNDSLLAELENTLQRLGVGDKGTLGSSPEVDIETQRPRARQATRGEDICKELEAMGGGEEPKSWRQFEDRCKEAILFLFDDQFGYWAEQSITSDGLHRRDFVVRLRPKHDFWVSLAHDFRSRYVVFEFKNYSNPISQGQIYSTEKYLYTAALRSIAIIIARNGADENAFRAAEGALREAGKLILITSMDGLCQMLRARDRGEDPEALLYGLLDEALTGLGR